MILAKGKLYDSSEQGRILSGMEEEINHTLAEKRLRTVYLMKKSQGLPWTALNGTNPLPPSS